MMEKKVKEQMSLHRFLARNILILIVAAVIIAAGTLFAGDYLGRALVKQPDVSVILNQSALYEKRIIRVSRQHQLRRERLFSDSGCKCGTAVHQQ